MKTEKSKGPKRAKKKLVLTEETVETLTVTEEGNGKKQQGKSIVPNGVTFGGCRPTGAACQPTTACPTSTM